MFVISMILLLLGCLSAGFAQVKFTNVDKKYNELKVEPVLVNEGSLPISLRTTDGMVDVQILYFDKRKGGWHPWPAMSYCGNVIEGRKVILPGTSESLPLFWGIQESFFGVDLPRTEYKLSLEYILESSDTAGKQERRVVESETFRLELPRKKAPRKFRHAV